MTGRCKHPYKKARLDIKPGFYKTSMNVYLHRAGVKIDLHFFDTHCLGNNFSNIQCNHGIDFLSVFDTVRNHG